MLRSISFAALALLAAAPAAAAPALPEGIWINPRHSVAVRTGSCGARLCGWVVWASAEAQGDARDSGTGKLIGTKLLQDYRAEGDHRWKGTVFVPDMQRSFDSEIAQVSPVTLKIKGCILGGFICKSQLWTQIAEPPRG
ncbi:DUF2147 domain-containing protein [Sphingomonas sp. RS2018]